MRTLKCTQILLNPFSGDTNKDLIIRSINDFPLNVTQNVTCNSVNLPTQYPGWKNFYECQVWNTCFFDVDMIEDLQENAEIRYNRGYHLLYASAGLAVAFIVLLIISLCILFECGLCTKNSQYI